MYRRIRSLRENLKINQTEMAKLLNMSQTGYSQYETGTNDVPTTILIKLAKIHNTSVDYILNLTDDSRPYKRKNDTM